MPNSQATGWALFWGLLEFVLIWGVAGAAVAWWYFKGATKRAETLLNLDKAIDAKRNELERLTGEVQAMRHQAPPRIAQLPPRKLG